jgi:hypothetical protein
MRTERDGTRASDPRPVGAAIWRCSRPPASFAEAGSVAGASWQPVDGCISSHATVSGDGAETRPLPWESNTLAPLGPCGPPASRSRISSTALDAPAYQLAHGDGSISIHSSPLPTSRASQWGQ